LRKMSRRGVLYVTMVCQANCHFCYYRFKSDKEHEPLAKLKGAVDLQRNYYGFEFTDVTGGEPTLHPQIREIVSYCDEVGLKPTVITNGLLPNVVRDLIHNGLDDLLLSVEGLGDIHDKAVGVNGAFQKVNETIKMLKEENFRFRTNTTMTKVNMENLPALADFLVTVKPTTANFIAFNLGGSGLEWWAKETDIPFQARYSEIAPYLVKAIDTLASSGIRSCVQYFPMCALPDGYQKLTLNFMQHMYDPTGWNPCATYQLSKEQIIGLAETAKQEGFYGESDEERLLNYLVVRRELRGAVKSPNCMKCVNFLICDGFWEQYVRRFGIDEAKPIAGNIYLRDPAYWLLPRLYHVDSKIKGV